MAWSPRFVLAFVWGLCAVGQIAHKQMHLDVTVFEDKTRARAYPAVTGETFLPLTAAQKDAGYSSSVFWLRIRLASDYDTPTSWLIEPSHSPDRAELYDGAKVRRSGKLVPYAERDVHANLTVFHADLPPRAEQTFYLRLESTDTLGLGIDLSEAAAFAERERRAYLIAGAYYGLVFGIIVYNLSLYLSTRDRPYLLYVFFQTSFALLQASMDRFGFDYIWSASIWFAQKSDEVIATLVMFFAVRFCRAYLETAIRWRALDRALSFVSWSALLLTTAALIRDDAAVKLSFAVMFIPTIGLLLHTGALATWRGVPNGPFFLSAWVFFIAGCFLHMLSAVGVLQVSEAPALAVLKLGSACEATLLSLGLGNRLRLLRNAEKLAQAQLLEDRRAHAQLLEARVEERTRELRAAQDLVLRNERLATLGRLAASIGHEVGNPLNFVSGGAGELEHALSRGALDDVRRALNLIVSGSDRIKKVVANLRRYVASTDVALEPTELVRDLATTLDFAANLCTRCAVDVVRDFEPLPTMSLRPGELEQVFMNLIINACDAMKTGGTLTVSTKVLDHSAQIRFADNGPGVPADQRDTIFEAFGKGPGGGSGLGLFVSREIVARHGGNLHYADNTGAETGATFVVSLPIR